MGIIPKQIKSYSQNQEQSVIVEYFGSKTGNFLDLGANDGVTLSNTRALAEAGWCGVMVEPSPDAFKKLRENYGQLNRDQCFYFYQVALGTSNKKVKFFDSGPHLNNGDVGLLGTFHETEKQRWGNTMQFTEIEVQCYRWKTFFNRLSVKTFDFISIDIEGSDRVVLEQMDLQILQTSCLCFEWNGNENLKKWVTEYVSKWGMKQIYQSGENLIFAK